MTPQEYTINSIKKSGTWSNSYGQFQSYAMALKGVGEPVKMNKTLPVNKEPVEGDTLYGHLEEETAADGRVYYKFKSDPRPELDEKQQSIQAQWSIRLAVEIWIAQGCDHQGYDNIETEARHFMEMVTNLTKGEKAA